MLQVYGIKNCDTVKKALKWLDANQCDYQFHDMKKATPDSALIGDWLKSVDNSILINRRGTTWRKLSDEQKALTDHESLTQLISDNTSLLKRPLVGNNGQWQVGFNAEQWSQDYL